MIVSIRAPARGATPNQKIGSHWCAVSIRAPARGATTAASARRRSRPCFDPRPRTGGDHRAERHISWRRHVSIRAPARGATEEWQRIPRSAYVSIRAPARGATIIAGYSLAS